MTAGPDAPDAPATADSLAGLRLAVTGASGFCGGHVARAAVERGAHVVALGRRPVPVGEHRFWDAARTAPDLAGVDAVVHCAADVGDPAPGSPQEAAMHAVNVEGTARLLEATDGRPVTWVSSASVYDPRRDRGLVTESHPRGGHLNAYGRTKAAGERLALEAGAMVLRPRAVYGEGDTQLLPRLLSRVRAGTLLLPGPDVPLSLTAVENLADACLASVAAAVQRSTPPGVPRKGVEPQPAGTYWLPGAYNIADATPYRRDAAVSAVLRAHGVRARIRHLPRPVARAAGRAAEEAARRLPHSPTPPLTRYAVDQLASPVVLDVTRARAQNWTPHRCLDDYLTDVQTSPAAVGQR